VGRFKIGEVGDVPLAPGSALQRDKIDE